MPIYEYSCPRCGEFEHLQPSSAKALTRCPKCRSKVSKLISASSFHLKGGGWYSDGYQKPGGGNSKGESKSPAKSPDKTATSTSKEGSKDSPKSTSSSSDK